MLEFLLSVWAGGLMSRTIKFTDEGGQHVRGAEKCVYCCCRPGRCDNDQCDGIIHDDLLGGEYVDDDHWWFHAERCDKCHYEKLNNGEYA